MPIDRTTFTCISQLGCLIGMFVQMVTTFKSGYMLRKLRNSPGWQKLWIVLANFSLFFFKTHTVSAVQLIQVSCIFSNWSIIFKIRC